MRSVRGYRVPGVCYGEHPHLARYFVALQAIRVAGAVVVFVVIADQSQPLTKQSNRLKEFLAQNDMPPDGFHLNVREGFGLVEQADIDCDLADVMQRNGLLKDMNCARRQVYLPCKHYARLCDPLGVSPQPVVPGFDNLVEQNHKVDDILVESGVFYCDRGLTRDGSYHRDLAGAVRMGTLGINGQPAYSLAVQDYRDGEE